MQAIKQKKILAQHEKKTDAAKTVQKNENAEVKNCANTTESFFWLLRHTHCAKRISH